MQKFDFSILTRDGQKVESIVIAGRDQSDAERKLRQMYRYCEVVSCNAKLPADRKSLPVVSVEEILSLIPSDATSHQAMNPLRPNSNRSS